MSITTLVLLGGAILRCLTRWPPVDHRARFALLAFIAIAALALYPMALGIGLADPYRLGYETVKALAENFKGIHPSKRVDMPVREIVKADLEKPDVQKLLFPPWLKDEH